MNCRNIWFNEYWSQHHRCSLNRNDENACTGNETMGPYEQEGLVPFVGEYTVAVYCKWKCRNWSVLNECKSEIVHAHVQCIISYRSYRSVSIILYGDIVFQWAFLIRRKICIKITIEKHKIIKSISSPHHGLYIYPLTSTFVTRSLQINIVRNNILNFTNSLLF